MTTIKIKGNVTGGNNQFGDNNQQTITSNDVLKEVNTVLTQHIRDNVSEEDAPEYIQCANIITDIKTTEAEKKSAANRIGNVLRETLPLLSEMAGPCTLR